MYLQRSRPGPPSPPEGLVINTDALVSNGGNDDAGVRLTAKDPPSRTFAVLAVATRAP
jgi:hypothetical protein